MSTPAHPPLPRKERAGLTQTDGTVPEDPIEQFDIALENLCRNPQSANMVVQDILKLTFYRVGEVDATRRRQLLASKLKGHKPCMTLLFVASLASPIYKVEIDAWASSANQAC